MSAKECLDQIAELRKKIDIKIAPLMEQIKELEDLIYDDICSVCAQNLIDGYVQCDRCGNVICIYRECGEYDWNDLKMYCRDCMDFILDSKEKEIVA